MILFCLLIFLAPFETHPLLSGAIGGLTPIKWIGIFAVAKSLLVPSADPPLRLTSSRLGVVFLAIVFWAVLSWAYGGFKSTHAVQTYLSLVMLYVVALRTVDSEEKIRTVQVTLIATMALSSVYLLKEYFVFSRVYGSDFRPWGGTFNDSNYFSLSAIIALPLVWGNYRTATRTFMRVALAGMGALISVAVVVAQSRGAIVGLLGVAFSAILLSTNRLKGLVVAALALALVGALLPERVWVRIRNTQIVEDVAVRGDVASTTRRWHLFRAGLRMVGDHPLMGVGLGEYKVNSMEYEPKLEKPGIAHCTYLELAAEQGLPALALFLFLGMLTYKELLVITRSVASSEADKIVAKTTILSLTGYFVAALFLSGENTKTFWITLFAAIAFREVRCRRSLGMVSGVLPYVAEPGCAATSRWRVTF